MNDLDDSKNARARRIHRRKRLWVYHMDTGIAVDASAPFIMPVAVPTNKYSFGFDWISPTTMATTGFVDKPGFLSLQSHSKRYGIWYVDNSDTEANIIAFNRENPFVLFSLDVVSGNHENTTVGIWINKKKGNLETDYYKAEKHTIGTTARTIHLKPQLIYGFKIKIDEEDPEQLLDPTVTIAVTNLVMKLPHEKYPLDHPWFLKHRNMSLFSESYNSKEIYIYP